MCNFYIMYYTSNDDISLISNYCWAPPPSRLRFPALPPLPVAATPSQEEEEEGTHSHSDMGDHKGLHPHLRPVSPGLAPPTTPLLPRKQLSVTTTVSPPPIATTVAPPPIAATVAPPPITTTLPPAVGTLVQAEDWPLNGFPIPTQTLGQITAVAIDSAGDVHILHRGPVTWNSR